MIDIGLAMDGVVLQSTDYIATQLMNGIVLGMIYALVAIGLSLIFGMMGIINFAHGDMLLVGAYVTWWVSDMYSSILLGLIVAPIVVFGVGLLVERVLLRYVYDRSQLLQLVLTFGIAEVLRQLVQMIWGSTGHSFNLSGWAQTSVDLVVFTYPTYRLFVLSVSALTFLTIYLFLTRTDIGLIVRAGSQDRELVNMLGIDIQWVYFLLFGLGAALAGWAGALVGPTQSAYPNLGISLLIPAFVVVIVGGVGTLGGTLLAGLLVGLTVVITGIFYPTLSNVIIYVLMAVVLLVRPGGLFGQSQMEEN